MVTNNELDLILLEKGWKHALQHGLTPQVDPALILQLIELARSTTDQGELAREQAATMLAQRKKIQKLEAELARRSTSGSDATLLIDDIEDAIGGYSGGPFERIQEIIDKSRTAPVCGACPGDGSICAAECRLASECPQASGSDGTAAAGASGLSNADREFLVWLLNNRIEHWENYVLMVEESKQTDMPILGTDEDDCKVRINKARGVLANLAKVTSGSDETQSVKVDERATRLFDTWWTMKAIEYKGQPFTTRREAARDAWNAALAQQAAPVAPTTQCSPNCFWGDCPPCIGAGTAPATKQAGATDFPHIASLSEATTRPYDPVYQVWNRGAGAWDDVTEREYDAADAKSRRITYKPAATTASASIGDDPEFHRLLANCEASNGGDDPRDPADTLRALIAYIDSRAPAPSRDAASDAPAAEEVRDAGRYRWLVANVRTGSIGFGDWWINADEPESEWDAAIDAAMSASQGKDGAA